MARRKFINAKLKGYNELQEILVEDGVFKRLHHLLKLLLTVR